MLITPVDDDPTEKPISEMLISDHVPSLFHVEQLRVMCFRSSIYEGSA